MVIFLPDDLSWFLFDISFELSFAYCLSAFLFVPFDLLRTFLGDFSFPVFVPDCLRAALPTLIRSSIGTTSSVESLFHCPFVAFVSAFGIIIFAESSALGLTAQYIPHPTRANTTKTKQAITTLRILQNGSITRFQSSSHCAPNLILSLRVTGTELPSAYGCR